MFPSPAALCFPGLRQRPSRDLAAPHRRPVDVTGAVTAAGAAATQTVFCLRTPEGHVEGQTLDRWARSRGRACPGSDSLTKVASVPGGRVLPPSVQPVCRGHTWASIHLPTDASNGTREDTCSCCRTRAETDVPLPSVFWAETQTLLINPLFFFFAFNLFTFFPNHFSLPALRLN